ncbi:MAG TPA: hypothetical protein ENK11_10140 [Phycisphaerales bacterium]|nr:hypothetical protein [Phycisphaerales bacterium]
MIRSLTSASALALFAAVGMAAPVNSQGIDRSGYSIYQAQSNGTRGTGVTYYSDMQPGPDGYVAFPATPINPNGAFQVAGTADYTSTSVSNISMDIFKFVGGVDQAGGVAFFDFYDAGGNYVDGFGVQFSQAGNFIWTITLTSAIDIAGAGFVQMSVDDEDLLGLGSNAAAQWFLGNNGADVGDAGAPEASPDFNFNFEISSSVPTPGAFALLGLGGLAASRRRR